MTDQSLPGGSEKTVKTAVVPPQSRIRIVPAAVDPVIDARTSKPKTKMLQGPAADLPQSDEVEDEMEQASCRQLAETSGHQRYRASILDELTSGEGTRLDPALVTIFAEGTHFTIV